MEPIRQEDPFGCGIACVAFVTDISYEDSLKLFEDGKSKAKKVGFLCKEIVNALKFKGQIYEYKYVKIRYRKIIYNQNTIVFIKRSNKYPTGHYLVRANNKWMDPWINFPYENAKAGFRKRLPGKPIYMIFPFAAAKKIFLA
mgnify:CR=1 FL=1